MYFDARQAKALPPDGYIVVQGCPGLRLEASNSGKSWIYRYKSPVDGRMRQVKFGQWPAIPIAQAVGLWEELRATREAGRDPSLERKAARQARDAQDEQAKAGIYTVERLLGDYLDNYIAKHRDARNGKALRSRLTRAVEGIKDLEPSSITRSVAFQVIEEISDRPVMAKSVRQELGGAWDYAHDSGALGADVPNWWRQVYRRKLKSMGQLRDGEHKGADKRVLDEAEVRRLIRNDFSKLSEAIQDVLTLYLWTCARGVEICALHASLIKIEGGVIWATLPRSMTKNRHRDGATDFRIPFVGRAASVVRRRMMANPGGFLFPGRHATGHIQQTNVQTQLHSRQPYSKTRPGWERERLEVTHWSPHDLRRTGRTMLAKAGCPSEVGEAILGHVTPGVAGIYDRYAYDAEKLQWLTVHAETLESLIAAI